MRQSFCVSSRHNPALLVLAKNNNVGLYYTHLGVFRMEEDENEKVYEAEYELCKINNGREICR